MTELFTTSGAPVSENPSDDFATRVCHFTFPVFALMATKYPSRLPKKSELSRIASPLFTFPTSNGKSTGMGRSYFQITAPVFASRATTVAGGSLTKIVPLTTRGVDWNLGSFVVD